MVTPDELYNSLETYINLFERCIFHKTLRQKKRNAGNLGSNKEGT